jgi:hypothetical protein
VVPYRKIAPLPSCHLRSQSLIFFGAELDRQGFHLLGDGLLGTVRGGNKLVQTAQLQKADKLRIPQSLA